jgi:hypothetical protein
MTEPSIPRIEMLDVADARERANAVGVPGALAELTVFRALSPNRSWRARSATY